MEQIRHLLQKIFSELLDGGKLIFNNMNEYLTSNNVITVWPYYVTVDGILVTQNHHGVIHFNDLTRDNLVVEYFYD